MDLGSQAAGIGVLADATRRALYEYVVAQPGPVGREQAAAAVDLPLHRASFHLDRLVAEGLLDVEFRRLTGRSGPGAGRPSKLYRRADREFAVSLPERRYDLVGDILAAAVARAAEGAPLEDGVERVRPRGGARGGRLGRVTGTTRGAWPPSPRCSRPRATSRASSRTQSCSPTAPSTPWPASTPRWCAA